MLRKVKFKVPKRAHFGASLHVLVRVYDFVKSYTLRLEAYNAKIVLCRLYLVPRGLLARSQDVLRLAQRLTMRRLFGLLHVLRGS